MDDLTPEAVSETVPDAPVETPVDASAPVIEPVFEAPAPDVPESAVAVVDTLAPVGKGGEAALLPIAPAGAVEAERRFNGLTGRVERFTASGDLIL